MITEWEFKVLPHTPTRVVCNDGTFYSTINGKKLNLKLNNSGYLRVRVYDKEESYKWSHRLVAEAFVGPVEGKHVHHKNKIRTDNYYTNFEIKEPEEHRQYHGNERNN